MPSNRAGQRGPRGVALAASGMVVFGLVAPSLGTAPAAGAATAAPTAYVADNLSNAVTPIDTATNTPGTAIPVETRPTGTAITPDGATLYVADFDTNSVIPIDTATNTPGTPIPVGIHPELIAITPDGTTAYVVNNGSNSVTPINTATNTPGTPDPGGDDPLRDRHHPQWDDRLRDQQQLRQLGDSHRHRHQHPRHPDPGGDEFPKASPSPRTARPHT